MPNGGAGEGAARGGRIGGPLGALVGALLGATARRPSAAGRAARTFGLLGLRALGETRRGIFSPEISEAERIAFGRPPFIAPLLLRERPGFPAPEEILRAVVRIAREQIEVNPQFVLATQRFFPPIAARALPGPPPQPLPQPVPAPGVGLPLPPPGTRPPGTITGIFTGSVLAGIASPIIRLLCLAGVIRDPILCALAGAGVPPGGPAAIGIPFPFPQEGL